jgi:PAS domain S-box-containing protein
LFLGVCFATFSSVPFQKDDQRASYFVPKNSSSIDKSTNSVRPSLGWLVSLLALALAFFLQKLVWPLIPASPFLLFYPVIFLSAWLGGRVCGVSIAVISAVLVEYAFLPPYGEFNFRQNGLSELIFIAIGFSITVVINRQKETHAIAIYAGSRLRNLVDWLDHAIVWEMDAETSECSFVSKGSERLLQIPIGEWYQRPGKFIELVHPEDRARVLETLNRAAHGPNDQSVEHRFLAADGRIRWYQTGIHADREEGRTKFRAISVEIERLKQTEERERTLKEQSEAAEHVLKLSQERLQLALDAAHFGTFEWDMVSERHIWDARTQELFGFAPGTFPQTREAFRSRLHPDDVERVLLTVEKVFRERKDLLNEYRVVWPNGDIRWVSANGRAYYDASGNPVRIIGVIQDITDRKVIESRLVETADRVDLALKAGKIGIFEMDMRHPEIPIQWSTRQYEIFGMDPTEKALNYETFRKRIHPDDLAAMDREFEASVREKRDFSQTYRIIIHDGSVRWVQARARAFYDEKGQPTRMIGTNIDATEAIQAQEAIRESAIRFRELAESMPQIVWATDSNGKAYYYNSQWFEFLGVPPTDAKSVDQWKFIHPEDKEKTDQRWEEAIRNRTMFQVEARMKRYDGSYHWFLSRALPIFNSQGNLVRWYGTLTNIDEHKKVEEMTSRALKAREEMLAIVSHDLRNPLGSILMSAAMIKRKSPSDDGFTMAQANQIQRAGERMNQMIEDLLNLAKIESGNYAITKREVCGCNVVTEAVEMMSAQAQEKNIKIETSGTDQPLQMSCDHTQILRVFSNLIGNAIKFTPEFGWVRVAAEDQGKEVLFTVSDTGPGIAEHHIPHVFDRFWQASKTQHMGTGLGLAISKGIVEAHGGRIWVTSRFGHGATFLFTLPKASGSK